MLRSDQLQFQLHLKQTSAVEATETGKYQKSHKSSTNESTLWIYQHGINRDRKLTRFARSLFRIEQLSNVQQRVPLPNSSIK